MPSRANERETERLAKLLLAASEGYDNKRFGYEIVTWDDVSEYTREEYREMSRAVIADRAAPKGAKKR